MELEQLLRERGATGFGSAWEGPVHRIECELEERRIRFVLRFPTDGLQAKRDQEERRLWRALLLMLKGKFEAIDSGISTFEKEFIGATIIPGGKTVAEWLGPQIEEAYKTGKVPRFLLGPIGGPA